MFNIHFYMNFTCPVSLKDIKSYQIIIYRNHAVGPKESGKSCRAVKPAAFSSSCVKSLRSDPCTSAKAASMSRLGWPTAMSSSSEKPGTKETSKGYKDEQRWTKMNKMPNPKNCSLIQFFSRVTLLLFSISIVFYSFHSISRLRISCDACTHQLQCREDLQLFGSEAQPSKLTGRNTSWRDAFDALQSEMLFQTIQKSWENGSIHCKLMWVPRKDSWILRSLRDWLSFLYDLTAIAFRHVSTGCQAIRRFSNIQDAALFQLWDNHRIVKQLVLQLKLTTNAVKSVVV